MKLEPMGDKVIVRRSEAEEQTAGGILLPSASQAAPLQGRVLSVGDGRRLPDGTRVASQVQEGDRVVFNSYAGMEIVFEEEQLLILSEDEILAVLD
jgi:chaperonin GroES